MGLLGLLLSLVAHQRGRTRRQIISGLAAILLCVAGAVGTGLALRVNRAHTLLEYSGGSLSLGRIRGVDLAGLVVVGALLVVTLMVARWLTADGDGFAAEAAPTTDGGDGVGSGDPTYDAAGDTAGGGQECPPHEAGEWE